MAVPLAITGAAYHAKKELQGIGKNLGWAYDAVTAARTELDRRVEAIGVRCSFVSCVHSRTTGVGRWGL